MKKIFTLLLMVLMLFSSFAYAETDEPSSWAEGSVEELKSYNEFRSDTFTDYKENITRAEFIYIAVRLYELFDGEEITPDPSISFSDTDDIYALKGASVGITSGIGDNKFGPDALLTREQLAVLMMNTLKLGNVEMTASNAYKFNDENEFSSWAKDSVYSAKANDIISGVGNDTFNPQGNATKEVAIIIANKILKNNNGKEWTRANGEIGHIIDLSAKGSGEAVPAHEIIFRDSVEFVELMSKYGTNTETQIFVSARFNGFAYYEGSYPVRTTASVDAVVSDGGMMFTFNSYNDNIKNVVLDFMDFAYSADNGHRDAVLRMFADIEGTYGIRSDGKPIYETTLIDGKVITVGDVKISYYEDSTFRVELSFE